MGKNYSIQYFPFTALDFWTANTASLPVSRKTFIIWISVSFEAFLKVFALRTKQDNNHSIVFDSLLSQETVIQRDYNNQAQDINEGKIFIPPQMFKKNRLNIASEHKCFFRQSNEGTQQTWFSIL